MVYNDGEGDVKICKRDFRELLTHDADSGEFQRLFKFGQSHLDVTNHEKQRVYLAVQTLSESVANAFTLLGKHKHAKFIMTVDRWFHVCDSRTKDHEKPFKAALQVTHEEEQLLCLQKMIDMMQCIRFASGHQTKHFQKGVIAGTKSIMALYHELKAEGQAFQCTYLLNQVLITNIKIRKSYLMIFFIRMLWNSSSHIFGHWAATAAIPGLLSSVLVIGPSSFHHIR